MRVVKLSSKDEDFGTDKDFENFFSNVLPNRDPSGKFRVTNGKISEEKFGSEERVLFQYKRKIRRIAQSKSKLEKNQDNKKKQYPYCFVIDLESMKEVQVHISDIENEFQEFQVSLRGPAWIRISKSKVSDGIWKYLMSKAT